MHIPYRKRSLHLSFIFGMFWLLLFVSSYFTKDGPQWMDYRWLFISLLSLGLFYYQNKYPYVKIEKDALQIGGGFGKTVRIDELLSIKKFAGDYILKTATKEAVINPQALDRQQLQLLDAALKKLDVLWVA